MPHKGGSKSIATLMDEQVLGNEKSGYVHGLGLGPTPSLLWGGRSSLGNIATEDSSNEVPDTSSGHERVSQTSRIPSVIEHTPPSHGK
ncbi:hypothetical protein HAX54_033807 [Datura stramonium]|uniref:Uncharacterized protein n=1 Tax=Datura stramonium TaxID=4076 RepID=A0ABS8SE03_DATST|nr:hypothetical protein [Datura stramonium]